MGQAATARSRHRLARGRATVVAVVASPEGAKLVLGILLCNLAYRISNTDLFNHYIA